MTLAQRRLLVAAYTAGLLALTLPPVPDRVGDLFPAWFDKVVHFGLFASFAVLLYWYRTSGGAGQRTASWSVVGPAAALAGLIELAQGPLPHRSGDPWDFVFGVIGALGGYVAARAWAARR